ncbi:c-type cytochrome [Cupriavidus pauculus]|uniref:Cytochrome C n=1 Tax=Cupriavidus pauculus TaxID=82633 RepID=A0A2N5CG66_9BURK|nr:c-type cytochrome [Cupriavidus pauculus]PLQ01211.1 cytochrome C [Cupriavidus pauculus]
MHPAKVIGAALLAAALPMAAHANAELAKSKNCMACHSVDKKLVGPAFKDVAAKYKSDKDAAAKLSQSILKGSTGKWGPIPMPANAVSDTDASALAKWVLTL